MAKQAIACCTLMLAKELTGACLSSDGDSNAEVTVSHEPIRGVSQSCETWHELMEAERISH